MMQQGSRHRNRVSAARQRFAVPVYLQGIVAHEERKNLPFRGGVQAPYSGNRFALGTNKYMPYELAFLKRTQVVDDSGYINDCCFGGDVVSDVLLPQIRGKYRDIQANQEDWGWFIWFKGRTAGLAVDIYCDDRLSGDFRIHLTSREKGWLGDKIVDTPELEELKQEVVKTLEQWVGGPVKVEKLDKKYMPIGA